jgi:hypothetical protein
MCTYGSKKEPLPNFYKLRKGRQGLLNTLFSLNLGCLIWVGAIVKNSQYRQNRQKSPNFDLLTRLPQAKRQPFYFLLNQKYEKLTFLLKFLYF